MQRKEKYQMQEKYLLTTDRLNKAVRGERHP